MRDANVKVREKFELSLDGRQIASIVVGALVILGVVFSLGLSVGRQMAARHAAAGRGGDLSALDNLPAAGEAPPSITFFEKLPQARPPAPPESVTPRPLPASPPPATPGASAQAATVTADGSAAAAALAVAQVPATAAAAPAEVAPTPEPATPPPAIAAPAPPRPAAEAVSRSGTFVVQIAAAQHRADAERVAARFRAHGARVEAADVPGKGRFYRVRLGSFVDRAAAERYLKDLARETGAKGFVAEVR